MRLRASTSSVAAEGDMEERASRGNKINAALSTESGIMRVTLKIFFLLP